MDATKVAPAYLEPEIVLMVEERMAALGMKGKAWGSLDSLEFEREEDELRCPIVVGGKLTENRTLADLADTFARRFADWYRQDCRCGTGQVCAASHRP